MHKPTRRARKGKEIVLPATRPNAGIEVAYRRQLWRLIAEMSADVQNVIESTYKIEQPRIVAMDSADEAKRWLSAQAFIKVNRALGAPPLGPGLDYVVLAQDSAASILSSAFKRLAQRWLKRFDEAAPRLAAWFAQSVNERSKSKLKKILKEGGWAVEHKMTASMQDVMDATIHAQVGLIKSIPQQYLGEVETLVMQSVQAGRDLMPLAKELRKRYGITRRRAELIARDQNNKATASMNRVRYMDAGIEEAIWMHSGAGKEPRPTHVKAGRDKQRFKVAEGWFDPHEKKYIQPGELINCRCTSRPVLKGFNVT